MIERLGEFVIKKPLGEGGMGAVYLAYQESLDREVALKVLNERLCKDEKYIARFKREARSAASIIHPNVIQIYSIGEEAGMHYFAMEYVRGDDLTELMAKGRRFRVDETLDIVMQVAEACACATEAGIIHRDIKPANIMLTERGLVKVTDFGLAKAASSKLDVTDAGTIVGTANYMSPEQGQGKELDVRTDIYSLGVVFFELLAGRVPFVAEQPSAVLYMHVYETPPKPSAFNESVPETVDRMVSRMIAKKPEDRPRDANVLLAELRGLSQSLGTGRVPRRPAVMELKAEQGPAASDSVAEAPSGVRHPMRQVPSGALKALVADDMESVRKLYNSVLAELGFAVYEAGDGEEALSIWAQEEPTLVVLDLKMPKKNGLEVLQERGARDLGGQVIVVSARKDREAVTQAAAEGVCSYLTKPVNINELRSRIEKVMSLPGARLSISMATPTVVMAQSRQILVYDASGRSQSLYRAILESMGYQVGCVNGFDDACAVLEEDTPDLLLVAIGSKEDRARELLAWVSERESDMRIVAVTEEHDTEAASYARERNVGQVLVKPLRVDAVRVAVEKALSASKPAERVALKSKHFSRAVERQLAHDQAFTVFDFARELAGVLPDGARGSFEQRVETGTTRDIQTAVTNLLRKLRSDGRLEVGMRYVRYAYMHGNLQVRQFCLALLPELLDRQGEIEVLLKVITDEDFRMRCRVIQRLGELRAEEGIPLVARFLNDDVWKVRKAAAECLERFDLDKVVEPLILFYARSGDSLPDAVRRRLVGNAGAKEMSLLEELARHRRPEVRAFVAGFLGELRHKQSVGILLRLMRDREARVRAAAARAAGRVQNNRLHDGLLDVLTDANSVVMRGAVEGLSMHSLTAGAAVYLVALAERGRRISRKAVSLFATLNQKDTTLVNMLGSLDRQTPDNRKHLSLLLKYVLPDPEELNETVRLLNASDPAARRQGVERVTGALRFAYRKLSNRMRELMEEEVR